jgi:hypothetical protein
MPLVGAKAILLCSDDGNNVRAAQLWARANEVRFATVRVRHFLVTAYKVRLLVDSKETRGKVERVREIATMTWRLFVIPYLERAGLCVTCASGVSSATDLANAYHKINTTAFALEAISSLWNLGMCNAFVGTFSYVQARVLNCCLLYATHVTHSTCPTLEGWRMNWPTRAPRGARRRCRWTFFGTRSLDGFHANVRHIYIEKSENSTYKS